MSVGERGRHGLFLSLSENNKDETLCGIRLSGSEASNVESDHVAAVDHHRHANKQLGLVWGGQGGAKSSLMPFL
jgi:hypothetical protein